MSSPTQSLARRDEPTQLAMGSRGVELRSLEELYRFAVAVSKTPFAPRDFKSPEAIMIAVQYGLEIGLSPMQSLQGVAVVNGKPALYGDALLGVVLGSGLVEDISETIEGEGDARTAICRVKRRGMATPIVRTFSVKDAKAAGLWGKSGPWTQYPDRMLPMRARSWALRDGFSDVTRGLIAAEEAQDIPSPASGHGEPPKARAEQLMDRLRESKPEVAAVMEAHGAPAARQEKEQPPEEPDAIEADELEQFEEAVERDDEREQPDLAGIASGTVNARAFNLRDWAEELGMQPAAACKSVKAESWEAMTPEQCDRLEAMLKAREAKAKG